METTRDGLLNRRIAFEQPKTGFRVAVDTVLLAAAVPARAGEAVCDFGCGAGGAMLCVAARVPDITITGIEIQPELVELCRRNIAANNFPKLEVRAGDVTSAGTGADFEHVLMNPPYHDEARHDVSLHAGKRTANAEKAGDLGLWIGAAAQALKPGGILTLIHRADREAEILGYLNGLFGAIEILPILPKAGQPPKRIILRARKGAAGQVKHMRAFVLHKDAGGYTDAAEAVLRDAAALEFALN